MYRFIVLHLLICLFFKHNNGAAMPNNTSFDTSAYGNSHRCVWSQCNVTGYPTTYLGYAIDCCTLQVPLNYADPQRLINISMSRLTPLQSTTNNTLFALAGGPGSSGWTLFYGIAQLLPAIFGITVILPDQRGTGLSTLLSCDDNGSQDITIDCITYLKEKYGVKGIKQFSLTSAAHDLSVQIQSYKADYPGRISIFSVSFGTFWLDRFLLIYPNLIQSAVMDGVFNPILSSDSRADVWTPSVSLEFLSFCRLQPECSQYFPSDQSPHIMLSKILKDMDSGTQQCVNNYLTQYNLTAGSLRKLFLNLMLPAERYMDRTVIPAVIYRLNRCNSKDVKVLKSFFQISIADTTANVDTQNGPGFLFSRVLNYNIIESETYLAMNESEVDNKTISRWYESAIMSSNNTLQYYAIRSQWPKYPLDEYRFQISSYSPLLMLTGHLDAATIFHQAAHLATLTTTTRKFYGIPVAGHVTVNIALAGYLCPLQLSLSWAFPSVFPVEWSNPNCIRDLPTTIDFVGETELGRQASMKFFNKSKPFGPED